MKIKKSIKKMKQKRKKLNAKLDEIGIVSFGFGLNIRIEKLIKEEIIPTIDEIGTLTGAIHMLEKTLDLKRELKIEQEKIALVIEEKIDDYIDVRERMLDCNKQDLIIAFIDDLKDIKKRLLPKPFPKVMIHDDEYYVYLIKKEYGIVIQNKSRLSFWQQGVIFTQKGNNFQDTEKDFSDNKYIKFFNELIEIGKQNEL